MMGSVTELYSDEVFDGLTHNQTAALLGLLQTGTISGAAAESGLSRPTIYRYLEDAKFKAAYNRARRERLIVERQRLENLLELANRALEDVLVDPEASPATKGRVAIDIWKVTRENQDLSDIYEMLAELQDRINDE